MNGVGPHAVKMVVRRPGVGPYGGEQTARTLQAYCGQAVPPVE